MRFVDGKTVYSVSEVNSISRQTLEKLSFWVEGEISAFKGIGTHYRYWYFDLKDPQTGYKISCIAEPEIFTQFDLQNGQKVLILGHLTLWEKEGRFQMYVLKIEEFGQGFLLAQLEKLKEKLSVKGYFKAELKKSLPAYPANIAVISSWVSDAWHDFKKHSIDHFPIIKISFFDVLVQGQNSALSIVRALKIADRMAFDAIVLIRGGGSIEDLAAFNEEFLADTIYAAKTPIVVGVGHEKDVTIASLVADVSASTPTDAAKIITSDFANLAQTLVHWHLRILKAIHHKVYNFSQISDLVINKLISVKDRYLSIGTHLKLLAKSLKSLQKNLLAVYGQRLTISKNGLYNCWHFILLSNKNQLNNLYRQLNLLSPINTLRRGYSIVYDPDGRVLNIAQKVDVGSKIKVKLWRGQLLSYVIRRFIT